MRPRNEFMIEKEGWYNIVPTLPLYWKAEYDRYLADGKPCKFTRWVNRQNCYPDSTISKLGELMKHSEKMKFSCRYNDIIRVTKSPHYKTCMTNKYMGKQLYIHAEDPNVGIVYIPDKAGHFLGRAFVRSIVVKGTRGLLVYPVYGNSAHDIYATLSKLGPLFVSGPDTAHNLSKTNVPSLYSDVSRTYDTFSVKEYVPQFFEYMP